MKAEGCIGTRAGREFEANPVKALNSTGTVNGAGQHHYFNKRKHRKSDTASRHLNRTSLTL
jgi:hypothetical protein